MGKLIRVAYFFDTVFLFSGKNSSNIAQNLFDILVKLLNASSRKLMIPFPLSDV